MAQTNALADLIFTNGQVATMDADNRVVQALAVRDNRIAAVGAPDEIRTLKGANTHVVDLKGKTLLPGFIDAHCHLALYGLYLVGLDCRYPAVKSVGDITARVHERAVDTPPGDWIVGWGYDHKKLDEARHPTRYELDAAAPDNPVLLVRTDYHTSVANSAALAREGIDASTPDPKGGRIGRGSDGEPNGLLVDAAHMGMAKWALPDDAGFADVIRRGGERLRELGITTVHDAGGFGWPQFHAFRHGWETGQLPLRLYALVFSLMDAEATFRSFTGTGIGTGLGDDWFRLGHMKFMVDGSSSGPSAAVRQPYDSCPHDHGILYFTQQELDDAMALAASRGFNITSHAVGDRGVEMVVHAINHAVGHARPGMKWRPRIEHCGMVDEGLLAEIRQAGIVPTPQPTFCYDFGDGYLDDYGERVRYMFACRSFIDHGIVAAGSSDCPVTDPDPLLGIRTAVRRVSRRGAPVGPEQRISVAEALRLYTWNGAYASFDEDRKGSLEPGKLADLTVLSHPVLDLAEDALDEVCCVGTIIDGRVVFDNGL